VVAAPAVAYSAADGANCTLREGDFGACSLDPRQVLGGCPEVGAGGSGGGTGGTGGCVVDGMPDNSTASATPVLGLCGRWLNVTVVAAGGAFGACVYPAAVAGGGGGALAVGAGGVVAARWQACAAVGSSERMLAASSTAL